VTTLYGCVTTARRCLETKLQIIGVPRIFAAGVHSIFTSNVDDYLVVLNIQAGLLAPPGLHLQLRL